MDRQELIHPHPNFDQPVTDKGLMETSFQLMGKMGTENFNKLAEKYIKKNFGKWDEEDKIEKQETVKYLGVVNEYWDQTTKAGISTKQSYQILEDCLEMSERRATYIDERLTVKFLSKIFQNEIESGRDINQADLSEIKNLLKQGEKYGVSISALYCFTLGQRVGLSVSQNVDINLDIINAEYYLSGQIYSDYGELMRTLAISGIDPDSLVKIIKRFNHESPNLRGYCYQALESEMTYGYLEEGRTQKENFERIVSLLDKGQELKSIFEKPTQIAESKETVEITNLEVENDKYFIKKDGFLEILPVPYQVKRSLKDGLSDLKKLANANRNQGEEFGEGYWMFNPDNSTWYSLGGRDFVDLDRVTHIMLTTDLSKLGNNLFQFHLHPLAYKYLNYGASRDLGFPENFDEKINLCLEATPSPADYKIIAEFIKKTTMDIKLRQFLISPGGIVEYTIPNDIDNIINGANDIRKANESVLKKITQKDLENDPETLLKLFIDRASQNLLEGFKLQFLSHSKGLNFFI